MGKLKKRLGLIELVFFGIGAIVGTGIFVIPSLAANIAGVASFWVWLEFGVLTIFMALSFAELSSVYPHAGGPYKFVKETFGPFAGFVAGWLSWLVSWFTIASLAVAAVFYSGYFFNISRPTIIIASIAVLGIITLFNYYGLQWGIRAQYVLTAASILVLWFFITWGVHFINLQNFYEVPAITLPALFFAAVFVIEPFIGWETITYFAEEAKNPRRDLPKAIIYSSIFVTIIYSAVIFVTLGLIKVMDLKESNFPIAEAARVFLGPVGAGLVAIGGIFVLLGCLNSWIASTARLPYAMSREGYFPKFLGNVHKKHSTPHTSLLLQFIFASVAVLFASYEGIIYVLVSLAMMLYLMVFISLPFHRFKKNVKIPYKLPLGPLIPIISVLIAFFVLVQIKPIYLLIDLGLLASGGVVYWVYKKKQ